MENKYYRNRILCLFFITYLISSSSFAIVDVENNLFESFVLKNQSENKIKENLITNSEDYIMFPHLNYVPVDSISGDGSSFSINDKLNVSHTLSMTLNSVNDWTNSYSLQSLGGFSTDYLEYGLTVTGIRDTYTIRTLQNRGRQLSSTQIRVAQSFNVTWEYGIFYGAELYLYETGSSLGNNQMELFLVKADASGVPNMLDIRASDINGPYSASNHLPSSTWYYYDFYNSTLDQEAILEKGQYYIVANLSSIDDGSDSFLWEGNIGKPSGYETYYHDGTNWISTVNDAQDLRIDVKPAESDGSDRIFSDLSEIILEDGPIRILSTTQEISSTGSHTITSGTSTITRTSVNIAMNNTYSFSRSLSAISKFVVSNSSFLDESVDWFVSWSSGTADILTYSNPIREFSLSTPTDWNTLSFDLVMNELTHFSGNYNADEYVFDVSSFISGSIYPDSGFNFSTTSLNYLNNFVLDAGEYNLGYWTTNGTHATGYTGSTVNANIFVKDSTSADVLNGGLNFTLYDPNGNIVVKKNETDYINVIYTDLSSYTLFKTNQSSSGHYSFNTSFDPSINGTDLEGFWTAVVLWSNDTEIGFYSQQISVSKSTSASFLWEETPGGNLTNSTSIPIVRKNLNTVTVQVLYSNISDLYTLSEIGKPIKAATVTYNTSWGKSGDLNYVEPYYVFDIPINISAGDHSITLTATGTLLETHSITFDLTVYHTFIVDPVSTQTQSYYNDTESVIYFDVIDTSSEPIETIVPDQIFIYRDSVLLIQNTHYVFIVQDQNRIRLELQTGSDSMDLLPNSYEINITVAKEGFFEDSGQATTSETINLEVLEAPTRIELISADDEIYYGNETTVVFNYVNTRNGDKIKGVDADFEVSFDIEEAEVIDQYEINGDYYVTFRVLENPATSVHVFITISSEGYQSINDHSVVSIVLNQPQPSTGIPPFLYAIIGILALAAIIVPVIFITRRRIEGSKRREKVLFSRIYGLYESVLSITKLIIVHKTTGLPVYEMDLGSQISLDPSLITGFLSAISSMGVELRGDRAGSVKRLQYKNFYVTGSESGQFTIYTFSETELNEEIEEQLTVVSDWFAKMFSQITEDWDGSTEVFRMNLQGITEKIMKEIHLWIFYPFIASPNKVQEIEQMNGLRKLLINYITSHDNVTISRIFDEIEGIRIEKGLPIIFDFMEKGIITPVFDAYKIATVRF